MKLQLAWMKSNFIFAVFFFCGLDFHHKQHHFWQKWPLRLGLRGKTKWQPILTWNWLTHEYQSVNHFNYWTRNLESFCRSLRIIMVIVICCSWRRLKITYLYSIFTLWWASEVQKWGWMNMTLMCVTYFITYLLFIIYNHNSSQMANLK